MDAAEKITRQFLTFVLGDDIFAIDVSMAREIVDFADVTRVPQTPGCMLGVINLRGSVVPVIDMRLKFAMEAGASTRDTCVIVMEVEIEESLITVGALVDSVQEVINLDDSQIEPPPKLGTRLNTEHIQGMGNLGEKFIILLDIHRVFSVNELELVRTMTDSE